MAGRVAPLAVSSHTAGSGRGTGEWRGSGALSQPGSAPSLPPSSRQTLTRFSRPLFAGGTSKSVGGQDMLRVTGRESVPAVVVVAVVCLGFLALGIYLLYLGDQRFIVDMLVLGAACVFLGLATLVLGLVFVLRPLYRAARRQEQALDDTPDLKHKPHAVTPPRPDPVQNPAGNSAQNPQNMTEPTRNPVRNPRRPPDPVPSTSGVPSFGQESEDQGSVARTSHTSSGELSALSSLPTGHHGPKEHTSSGELPALSSLPGGRAHPTSRPGPVDRSEGEASEASMSSTSSDDDDIDDDSTVGQGGGTMDDDIRAVLQ